MQQPVTLNTLLRSIRLPQCPQADAGTSVPGLHEKPEAFRLPAFHAMDFAVQVCDSHLCTFSMYY